MLLIEAQKREQYVEKGIAHPMLAPSLLYDLPAVDDVVPRITPIININGSVDPYGKVVDEVALLSSKQVICPQVYDVVWVDA